MDSTQSAPNSSYRIEFVKCWVFKGLNLSDIKHSVVVVGNLKNEKHGLIVVNRIVNRIIAKHTNMDVVLIN